MSSLASSTPLQLRLQRKQQSGAKSGHGVLDEVEPVFVTKQQPYQIPRDCSISPSQNAPLLHLITSHYLTQRKPTSSLASSTPLALRSEVRTNILSLNQPPPLITLYFSP